jgi:hypothetical protein
MHTALTLSEELMLLAVHDDKGHLLVAASTMIPFGIASCILYDLKNNGKIEFDNEFSSVVLNNSKSTRETYLDFVLERISLQNKEQNFEFWVRSIAIDFNKIKEQILNNLVLKGILKRNNQKLFFLFEFSKYPTLNPAPETATRDSIHKCILMEMPPTEKLLHLIILIYNCNLIEEIFPKNNRELAKKRIELLIAKESLHKLFLKFNGELSVMDSLAIE